MKSPIVQTSSDKLHSINQTMRYASYSDQNVQTIGSNGPHCQSSQCLSKINRCNVFGLKPKLKSKFEHETQEIISNDELWNEFIEELRKSRVVTTMATMHVLTNFVNKKMARD